MDPGMRWAPDDRAVIRHSGRLKAVPCQRMVQMQPTDAHSFCRCVEEPLALMMQPAPCCYCVVVQ